MTTKAAKIILDYSVTAQNHDGSFIGLGWFQSLTEAEEIKAEGLAANDARGVNTYGDVWITEYYYENGAHGSRTVGE